MTFLGWVAHRDPESRRRWIKRLFILSQVEFARFESAGASALHVHTLPFGLNPSDVKETRGTGVSSAEMC